MRRPRWLVLPRHWGRVSREIDEEIAFHLAQRTGDLQRQGYPLAEAQRIAAEEFGDVDAARDELRHFDRVTVGRERSAIAWQSLADDARGALRSLARHRAFSAVVIAILAVGIAASASMFSLVDRLMFRPAPYIRDAGRLGHVYHTFTAPSRGTVVQLTRSYQDFRSLQGARDVFQDAGAWFTTRVTLGRDESLREASALVTDDAFYRVVGVAPFIGRTFAPAEVQEGGADVVIVSHGFWRQELGGRSDVLGASVDILGRRFTVIGVMPRGFRGLGLAAIELFLPLHSRAPFGARGDRRWVTDASWQWLNVVVRVRDGVSPAAAAERATTLYRELHAAARLDRASVVHLGSVLPGRGPGTRGGVGVAFLPLAVSALLLAMATANVATLLLNRAAARRRETSVRLALGVSRARLVRTHLLEGWALGLGGAVVGLVLAAALVRTLHVLILPEADLDGARLDIRAIIVSLVVATGAGLLAGLAPVSVLWRRDLGGGFATAGRAGTSAGAIRSSLVALQAAVSVALLVGATMLGRSLFNATRVDLGFDPRGLYALFPDLSRVPVAERANVQEALARQLRNTPMVQSVAASSTVPFWMNRQVRVRGESDTLPRFLDGQPSLTEADPAYFATLGVRVVRGRGLLAEDTRGAARVAVVNEVMAQALAPDGEAIGRCLYYGDDVESGCVRIVGVMANTRRYSIGDDERSAQFVIPHAQGDHRGGSAILVRVRGPSADLEAHLALARRQDSRIGLIQVQSVAGQVDSQVRPFRVGAQLLSAFGIAALVLAGFGLYTVAAYDATHRAHEIGVKLALGATPGGLQREMMRRSLGTVGLGAVAGLAVAWAASGALAPLLFKVGPHDPAPYLLAGLLSLTAGGMAGWRPSRRASRMDPLRVLRAE